MSRARSRNRSRPLVVLLFPLLLVGRMAMAQGENLIRNPGFEAVSGAALAEWETWTPRAEIAPEFGVDRDGGRSSSGPTPKGGVARSSLSPAQPFLSRLGDAEAVEDAQGIVVEEAAEILAADVEGGHRRQDHGSRVE